MIVVRNVRSGIASRSQRTRSRIVADWLRRKRKNWKIPRPYRHQPDVTRAPAGGVKVNIPGSSGGSILVLERSTVRTVLFASNT